MDAAKIAIFDDHINMVKFKNAEEDGFKKVCGTLHIMLQEASQKVDKHWEEWKRTKRL